MAQKDDVVNIIVALQDIQEQVDQIKLIIADDRF